MSTTVQNYLNRLTCTLFVVLGLWGFLAPAAQAASGSFTFSSAAYAVSEGAGKIDITINRLGSSTGAATVGIQTKQITAAPGSDYSEVPLTTLNFAHREKMKVVRVAIANDTLVDPNETLEVLLSNPTYGTILGSISNSVITIQDDDIVAPDTTAPTVALTSPANATTFTSAQTVTITAAASDNVGISKVELYDGVTLLSTDTSAPYSFAWAITSANNGSHSLSAKAYDAAGNSKVSAAAAVTVNIAITQPGAFNFSAASYTVSEGGGKVNVTINRVGGSAGAASVEWRTQTFDGYGTADWANDYGTFVWTAVNFADGESSKILPITIHNDTTIEGDETFSLLLQNPSNGSTLGTQKTSYVTIQDDDIADVTAPTVNITSAAAGTILTSAQTVTLTASAQDNVEVTKVEFYDGATLKGVNATSAWPVSSATSAGSVVATASWNVSAADNGTHTITCKAYDAAGNVKQSSSLTVTVNVAVAVSTPGAFQFLANSFSAAENAGKVNITINRVGGSSGAATVEWRTQTFDGYGTADWANDYGTFLWTAVNFADGESSKILPITINNDTVYEGNETFSILLQNPTNSTTLGTPTIAVVTIKDDDTASPVVSGPVKAFPGAQGYGSDTPGGRGGQIIKVTNLNASGAGSFRAALEASGPRIIVFEVGGTIDWTNSGSYISITNPYVTVAGQTAPFPGINIKGSGIRISTHDVVMQHLRFRIGNEGYTGLRDALMVLGGAYNVVLDHMSVAWQTGEGLSTWESPKNITFSNSIVTEGTMGEKHGMLLGDWSTNIAVIGNLISSNNERNPLVKGGTSILFANNVVYNAGGGDPCILTDDYGRGASKLAQIGNVYQQGPQTSNAYGTYMIAVNSTVKTGTQIYQADNMYRNLSGSSLSLYSSGASQYVVSTSPLSLTGMTFKPNSQVQASVVANAGARPAERDATDQRAIDTLQSKTGSFPSAPTWSTYSPTYRAFNPPSNPNGDDDGNGYTNIEETLYQMALYVEGRI